MLFAIIFACTGGKIYLPEDDDLKANVVEDVDTDEDVDLSVIEDSGALDEPSSEPASNPEEPAEEPAEEPTSEPSDTEDTEEICDGIDNNGDGQVDEGLTTVFYLDADGDGFGDSQFIEACSLPQGYVSNALDCDDSNMNIHPDADEVCNDLDDDCNSQIDDNPIDPGAWYHDADGDGFGSGSAIWACDAPAQSAVNDTDCDDLNADTYPGATEECDGLDNNCDGAIDDNANCPCAIETHNNHSYLFCKTVKNWHDAKSFCESYGSYTLVVINDINEQSWLWGQVIQHSAAHWWWLGYHNQNATSAQEPSGNWEWLVGNSSYTNWYPYYPYVQPDDTNNDEDCAHIDPAHGHWNDLDCDSSQWYGNQLYFVCESSP